MRVRLAIALHSAYALVGNTNLTMMALHGQMLLLKSAILTLSSRPERSGVEGPAVLPDPQAALSCS
jgi:hypothetical protein